VSINFPEQVLAEAAMTAVHKTIGDDLTGLRTTMQESLETIGIEKIGAKLPDGTKIATITVSNPQPKPTITDEQAFARFVEDIAPDEVITVKVVRPAYAQKLLEEMEKRGAAEMIDPGNGEILDVDGIEMKTRAASHSVTFETGGREAILAAMLAGQLGHL